LKNTFNNFANISLGDLNQPAKYKIFEMAFILYFKKRKISQINVTLLSISFYMLA